MSGAENRNLVSGAKPDDHLSAAVWVQLVQFSPLDSLIQSDSIRHRARAQVSGIIHFSFWLTTTGPCITKGGCLTWLRSLRTGRRRYRMRTGALGVGVVRAMHMLSAGNEGVRSQALLTSLVASEQARTALSAAGSRQQRFALVNRPTLRFS